MTVASVLHHCDVICTSSHRTVERLSIRIWIEIEPQSNRSRIAVVTIAIGAIIAIVVIGASDSALMLTVCALQMFVLLLLLLLLHNHAMRDEKGLSKPLVRVEAFHEISSGNYREAGCFQHSRRTVALQRVYRQLSKTSLIDWAVRKRRQHTKGDWLYADPEAYPHISRVPHLLLPLIKSSRISIILHYLTPALQTHQLFLPLLWLITTFRLFLILLLRIFVPSHILYTKQKCARLRRAVTNIRSIVNKLNEFEVYMLTNSIWYHWNLLVGGPARYSYSFIGYTQSCFP